MSDGEQALLIAGMAGTATLLAALIAAIAAYLASKRDRRRLLYGEAFKAALGWVELLYRVRRRSGKNDDNIVASFHTLQESLTYYEGWIASESKYMARSYRRLVKAVKDQTESPITAAWDEPIRPRPGIARSDEEHPDLRIEGDVFMRDVRAYLSPWQLRKIWVACRNWDEPT